MTTEPAVSKIVRPLILVVDDEAINCLMLAELLKQEYEVAVAASGKEALDRLCGYPPVDLVLLDVGMPGMDGYQVCRSIQSNPRSRHIPVIFVTGLSEEGDEARGLEEGAVDYIAKPYSPKIILARVHTHLTLRATQNALRDQNDHLEQIIARRTADLERTLDTTVLCLASLAETRDNETRAHLLRTQHYVRVLTEQLFDHPRFREQLSSDYVERLCKVIPLHDIGKLGVPDRILLKPGSLTPEEWQVMREHAAIGRDALLKGQLPELVNSFFALAAELAYSHHEKWNGTGYPQGLAGDAIPLSGRLMALADVYDALISRRCYKEPVSHEDAVAIIASGSGTHFDPDIVAAFLQLKDTFRRIVLKYIDEAV